MRTIVNTFWITLKLNHTAIFMFLKRLIILSTSYLLVVLGTPEYPNIQLLTAPEISLDLTSAHYWPHIQIPRTLLHAAAYFNHHCQYLKLGYITYANITEVMNDNFRYWQSFYAAENTAKNTNMESNSDNDSGRGSTVENKTNGTSDVNSNIQNTIIDT